MNNKNSYPYFYIITINETENGYKWKDLPSYDALYKYILNRGKSHNSVLHKIYKNLELDFSIIDINTNIVSLTVF